MRLPYSRFGPRLRWTTWFRLLKRLFDSDYWVELLHSDYWNEYLIQFIEIIYLIQITDMNYYLIVITLIEIMVYNPRQIM